MQTVAKCLVTSFYEYQLSEVKKFHVDKTNLILKSLILNKTYSCSVVKVGKRVEYCTRKKKEKQNKTKFVFFFSLLFTNPLAGKQVNKQIVLPLFLNESKR